MTLHCKGVIACERTLTNAYNFSRLLSFQVTCMSLESGNVVNKLALWLCYLLILCYLFNIHTNAFDIVLCVCWQL